MRQQKLQQQMQSIEPPGPEKDVMDFQKAALMLYQVRDDKAAGDEFKKFSPEQIKDAFEYLATSTEKQKLVRGDWRSGGPYSGLKIILIHKNLLEDKPYKNDVFYKGFQSGSISDPKIVFDNRYDLEALPISKIDKDNILYESFRSASVSDTRAFLSNESLFYDLPGDKNEKKALTYKALNNSITSLPGTILRNSYTLELEGTSADKNKDKYDILYKAFKGAAISDVMAIFDNAEPVEGKPDEYILRGKPYEKEIWQIVARENSLYMVQEFNENHGLPERFRTLKFLDPSEEFDLITKGREEAFSSTYLNIVGDMFKKLGSRNLLEKGVLTETQMKRMNVFLEAASSHGMIDEVLKYIPADKLPGIIKNMAEDIKNNDDLSYPSTMVNMMLALKEGSKLRNLLEKEIEAQYKAATGDVKDRFGVLSAAYGNHSKGCSQFFKDIAAEPRYEQPTIKDMKEAEITYKVGEGKDAKYVCNQLMVFASDDDSQKSYQNFLSTYENQPNWKIEHTETYTHIYNIDGNAKVNIYANKPAYHDKGLEDIKNKVDKFQIFIGRGHSYHSDDYIQQINPDMKLVYLGSCNGSKNLSAVLEKSPDAQVIYTTQTGSMYVNDPVWLNINNSIVDNRSIDWKEQKDKVKDIKSENKDHYHFPHENADLEMQRNYNDLKKTKDQGAVGKRPGLINHEEDKAQQFAGGITPELLSSLKLNFGDYTSNPDQNSIGLQKTSCKPRTV